MNISDWNALSPKQRQEIIEQDQAKLDQNKMTTINLRQNQRTWTLSVTKNRKTIKIATFEDSMAGRSILAAAARAASTQFLADEYDIEADKDHANMIQHLLSIPKA